MNKRFHIILCILAYTLSAVCGCKSRNSDNDSVAEKTIRIDVRESGGTVDFNEIFSSLEIIPLSNEPDAIINPRCIWRYTCSDSLMVFINVNMPNQIVIFDSAGKWLKTIDGCGKGPDEYLRLNGALINEKNGTLDILDGSKIIQYDIHKNYSVRKVIKLPDTVAPFYSFTLGDDGEYVLFTANDDDESSLVLFSPESKKSVEIDYNYPLWVHCSGCLTTSNKLINLNGETLFHEGYNGALYRIDERSRKLKKYLEFDFGDNNFKLDVVKPDKECFYYDKAFKKELTYKYALPVYVESTSSVICMLFRYNDGLHTVLYDMNEDTIKCFDSVAGLSYISLCGYTHKNNLYSPIPANTAIQNIDPKILDEENRQKLETLTEISNNVVLKFSFNNIESDVRQ